MTFRAATEADAETLFRWRQQQEAKPWYVGRPVSAAEHRQWLLPRLRNELVTLALWLEDGEPAGLVRVDSDGSVAQYAGSAAAGGRMLRAAQLYAASYGGRLKCCIDADDEMAAAALAEAGFVEATDAIRLFIFR